MTTDEARIITFNKATSITMSASRIAIRRIAALSGPRAQASLLGARPFTSLGETLTSKVSFFIFARDIRVPRHFTRLDSLSVLQLTGTRGGSSVHSSS